MQIASRMPGTPCRSPYAPLRNALSHARGDPAGPPFRQCMRTPVTRRGTCRRHRPQELAGPGKWARSGRECLALPPADGARSRAQRPRRVVLLQQFPAAPRGTSDLHSMLPLQLHLGALPHPRPPVSSSGMSLQSAAGEPQLPGPRACDHPCPKPATRIPLLETAEAGWVYPAGACSRGVRRPRPVGSCPGRRPPAACVPVFLPRWDLFL